MTLIYHTSHFFIQIKSYLACTFVVFTSLIRIPPVGTLEDSEEVAEEDGEITDQSEEQEDFNDMVTSAIPSILSETDLTGLSRREIKRLERQQKRAEKIQNRKNKQSRDCEDDDKKCCEFTTSDYVSLLVLSLFGENIGWVHNVCSSRIILIVQF